MKEYRHIIERLPARTDGDGPITDGNRQFVWAVVQWIDEGPERQSAYGADQHWPRLRFAHRAKRVYDADPALFGTAESILRVHHGLFIEPDHVYADTERWVLARLGAIATGMVPELSAAQSDRLAESAPEDEPQEWVEHWRISRHDEEDDIECWLCDEVADIVYRRAHYKVTSGPPPAVTDGTRSFYELVTAARMRQNVGYDPIADEWIEHMFGTGRRRTWSRLTL